MGRFLPCCRCWAGRRVCATLAMRPMCPLLTRGQQGKAVTARTSRTCPESFTPWSSNQDVCHLSLAFSRRMPVKNFHFHLHKFKNHESFLKPSLQCVCGRGRRTGTYINTLTNQEAGAYGYTRTHKAFPPSFPTPAPSGAGRD